MQNLKSSTYQRLKRKSAIDFLMIYMSQRNGASRIQFSKQAHVRDFVTS